MKKYISILSAFCFMIKIQSQSADSLFEYYTNYDLQIRQLNAMGIFSGNNVNSGFSYNMNGALNYSKFTNLAHSQSDFSTFFQLYNTREKDYYIDYNPIRTNLDMGIGCNFRKRNYLKPDFFIAYGIIPRFNRDHFHYEYSDPSQQSLSVTYNDLRCIIPLSVGWGRKYPLYSVHKSKWIYKDLLQSGRLLRAADPDEIEALAHLIDELSFTRFYDYRYKLIQDLTRIDSLLKNQKIIPTQDIAYYTHLTDMYEFSNAYNRFRGKTFEAGFYTYMEYSNNISDSADSLNTGTTTTQKSLFPFAFAEYNRFKPINLFWQFNLTARVEFGFKKWIELKTNSTANNTPLTNLEIESSLIFLPDTRNQLSLHARVSYGNKYDIQFYNNSLYSFPLYVDYYPFIGSTDLQNYSFYNYTTDLLFNPTRDKKIYTGQMSLLHYYYVNPRFRIQTQLNLNYSQNYPVLISHDGNTSTYKLIEKLAFDFGISVMYAIF